MSMFRIIPRIRIYIKWGFHCIKNWPLLGIFQFGQLDYFDSLIH